MKNLLLASVIAVTSTMSFGAVAYAQNTGAGTTTMTHKPRIPAGNRINSPNYMDRKCTMKTVRRHRNGQVVMEQVRTCK